MSVIPTARHIQYALGFIELGLLDQASDELEAIAFEDRFSTEVLAARVELHLAAKHWDVTANFVRTLTERTPANVRGWIAWAFALRELQRVEEAREVLLRAEPQFGETEALVHYNLACYECLLGHMDAAKARLRRACQMDSSCKAMALDDPDLQRMWDQIASIE
jgi:Flp pilus assembly protein TadD